MSKRWVITALLLCAAAVALLWPTSYLASPRWDVVVVDTDRQPLRGVAVRLVYQNYSTEGASHEITLTTDNNGHVLFLPQRGRANLIQRVFYTASSATAGVHGSFGQHAHVFAFGNGYVGSAVTGNYIADWRGFPDSIESQIVAKRR